MGSATLPVAARERAITWLGLILAVGGPAFTVALPMAMHVRPGPVEVAGPLLATTLALLAYVRWVEGKPLASIGLRGTSTSDIVYALAGFLVGFGCIVGMDRAFEAMGLHAAGSIVTGRPLSPAASILILAVNPLAEEVIFRGYLIERLTSMIKRISVAAGLSLVVFLALHVPAWGLLGALEFAPWTLVITGLYVWRRSLAPCIVMHVLGDAAGLVLIPWLGAT